MASDDRAASNTVPGAPWPPLDGFGPELPSFERDPPVWAERSIYRRLNLASGLLAAPLGIVFVFAHRGRLAYTLGEMLAVVLPCVLLLTPAHEGLHWCAARWMGVPARHCRFGFMRSHLLPYFRAMVPVPVRRYRIVLLTPGVLLTVLAAVPALWFSDLRWWVVAAASSATGIGDYYWHWRIRDVPADRWVWDRAGLVGLEVLRVRAP